MLELPELCLSAYTMTSALGSGLNETLDALRGQRTGLRVQIWPEAALESCVGEVPGLMDLEFPDSLRPYDCRNNRLALQGLQQDGFVEQVQAAIKEYGVDRIGVFLGTSTSGILSSELAYRCRDPQTGALPFGHAYQQTHNTYSVGDFVRRYFGLLGPAFVVSTACSSSAKVFGNAQRMIAAGLIDAAIVGGVDTLCLTTLYGFQSLQLVSDQACRPFDRLRNGISIAEAAGFALVKAASESYAPKEVRMTGFGESSDAYHMSSPHPEGLGAQAAMRVALQSAKLQAEQIDYINLHGTATPSNDAAEGRAVEAVFGVSTPCSSTKGHTGHTLGAAGGIEAVISALALVHDLIPGGVGTTQLDPELRCHYLLENQTKPLRHVMSNSFGFGGSNCSLILSKEAA